MFSAYTSNIAKNANCSTPISPPDSDCSAALDGDLTTSWNRPLDEDVVLRLAFHPTWVIFGRFHTSHIFCFINTFIRVQREFADSRQEDHQVKCGTYKCYS